MEKGDILDLEMTSLAYGGKGVAFYKEGDVPFSVFIPLTVPGDEVRAKITSLRHRFAEATLLEITKKSKNRIEPKCPYFNRCGGCDWQHMTYETQLAQKQRIVEEEIKKRSYPDVKIEKILPSNPFGYRDRARFHRQDMDGKSIIGLKERQGDKLIEVESCVVASDAVNAALKNLRTKKTGAPDFATSSVVPLPEFGINLHFYPPCFTQPNFEQNKALVHTVLEFLELKDSDIVLDLFCGIGNFSLPIARFAKIVVGVDGVPSSIKAAIENAQSHRMENLSFRETSALVWLKGNKLKFDKIVVDPPREGLGDAVGFINGSNAKRIVYVSCDIRSLIADLKEFTNYEAVRVQPIDMSPQTYHIETVVVLKKKHH